MFNNINDNNEFLYNSQFDKQSNIVNIAALRANVNKTIKTAYSNPYVDKTEISANAMEMFQRDCDINKFTKIAMETYKESIQLSVLLFGEEYSNHLFPK